MVVFGLPVAVFAIGLALVRWCDRRAAVRLERNVVKLECRR